MCGIAGFIAHPGWSGEKASAMLRLMSDSMVNRGPDDEGNWFDDAGRVGLTHRRLAIQDLSSLGHQPMESRCGRYVITLNGEIYNFHDLRRRLEYQGMMFRGHSDTEVLVSAISRWGLEKAVANAHGMFAFAVYDKFDRELWLVRDRAGEKPLFYGWNNGIFLFGSVLTAIEVIPEFQGEIDPNAVGSLLVNKYVAAPLSIYRGVRKLRPGHIARLRLGDGARDPETWPYWTHPYHRNNHQIEGTTPTSQGSTSEAKGRIKACLESVMREQVLSDRPIGAFLSGGVDSSLVTSLMQTQSGSPVRTFTVGFEEGEFDEASRARAIAKYLGTDHTEIYLPADKGLELVPEIASCFDEPFADSSQIPTMLISEVARQEVTVVLSGDGGDEVFGGYDRYTRTIEAWRRLNSYPSALRRPLARLLAAFDRESTDRLLSALLGLVSPRRRGRSVASLFRYGATRLGATDVFSIYAELMSDWADIGEVVPDARTVPPAIDSTVVAGPGVEIISLMASDFHTYLSGDVLVKVDRSSMFYSLETRAPLLDVRVIEAASGLNVQQIHNNHAGKMILRSILSDYLPDKLTDSPKRGFAVPISQWLRGPLRAWAEERLSDRVLNDIGFVNKVPVRKKWMQHKNGIWDNSHSLWSMLMLVEWMRSRGMTRH